MEVPDIAAISRDGTRLLAAVGDAAVLYDAHDGKN